MRLLSTAAALKAATLLTTAALCGQDDAYRKGPDSRPREVPRGEVTHHVFRSAAGVFAGTIREYWIYAPPGYDAKTPHPVTVFQDGHEYVKNDGPFAVPTVLDNLIHAGDVPPMIGVFVNPGHRSEQLPKPGWGGKNNRSVEYDTLSDAYARFLLDELLPEVAKTHPLTDNPDERAICGISSGGICAFTAAWERPDAFRKVVSHVGSFTNIRGGHVYPAKIRKGDRRPIRVFLQGGEQDLDNQHGSWWLANLQMESALRFAGYDYRAALGTGGHSGRHGGSIFPDTMRWLWRDHPNVKPRHSFFVAGPNFTGIVDSSGKPTWDSGRRGARDGWVLEDGNVLIAWGDEVKEMTREGKVVFHYRRSDLNKEIGTVQRLPNGNTLITELGGKPRLIEVTPDGTIAVDVPLKPETDNAHMQTRMARKLPNGDYLVPHLLAFKVKQYRPNGEVVREIATDLPRFGGREARNWPFTAIALENGNTLVTLTNGNKVAEFDSAGQVAWSVTNDDLPGNPLDDPCGAQRLPNGNTVIASYRAKKGIKLFEVTPDKKIVWTYEGPYRVHHFQVLTSNGLPLEGTALK